jgi:hypothetical protein
VGQSFGTAVEARLFRDGKPFERGEDFVGVHDNPWLVGIGGTLPGDFIGRAKPEQAEKLIDLARQKCANWLEFFFWAPDDWGNLTPTADRWCSGQASYLMEPGKLKRFIESALTQPPEKPSGLRPARDPRGSLNTRSGTSLRYASRAAAAVCDRRFEAEAATHSLRAGRGEDGVLGIGLMARAAPPPRGRFTAALSERAWLRCQIR